MTRLYIEKSDENGRILVDIGQLTNVEIRLADHPVTNIELISPKIDTKFLPASGVEWNLDPLRRYFLVREKKKFRGYVRRRCHLSRAEFKRLKRTVDLKFDNQLAIE